MSDYSELKRLAEACNPSVCADASDEGRRLHDFWDECLPSVVLGLIAEVERLKREEKNDAIAYRAAIERQSELRSDRDLLRSEVQALRADAARYRWVEPVFAGLFGIESLDAHIDAAKGNGEQA